MIEIIEKGWIRAHELKEVDIIVENMEIKKIVHKFHDGSLKINDNHNYLITEYRLLIHNAASAV